MPSAYSGSLSEIRLRFSDNRQSAFWVKCRPMRFAWVQVKACYDVVNMNQLDSSPLASSDRGCLGLSPSYSATEDFTETRPSRFLNSLTPKRQGVEAEVGIGLIF